MPIDIKQLIIRAGVHEGERQPSGAEVPDLSASRFEDHLQRLRAEVLGELESDLERRVAHMLDERDRRARER